MVNWSKYKDDPLYMFAAPMFKPADDPRSRLKFGADNFVDVIMALLTKIFAVLLEPIFKIFKLFTGALSESLGGLFNIRSLLGNMWNRFNDMAGIFMRRFNGVFHQLHLTFVKLFQAMDKTFAIAVSAVYEGLSTIHTITSFIDLIIKIIIIILVILVAIIILLIFVLWPFIPTILIVVGIIATTAMGGAVGGMASTFCFTGETLVHSPSGPVPIREIKIGDALLGGGTVTGFMDFAVNPDDLYELYGVQVSASHIVYTKEGAVHVSNHPDAHKLSATKDRLYCLITSNRVIPVESEQGILLFADWEELEQDSAALEKWHKHVFTSLNPGKEYIRVEKHILESEAVISEKVRVMTPLGPAEIRGIRPGDLVMDASGHVTRVTGIVRVADDQVNHAVEIDRDMYISAAAWVYNTENGVWSHPSNPQPAKQSVRWYSLFTESGSYKLYTFTGMEGIRDFTDVGPDRIHETYEWVLHSLGEKI